MIFVTVGTHEQCFDRLLKYMDRWAEDNSEEVIMQTGYSDFQPQFANWKKYYSYNQMLEYVKAARVVITHGGPSSFIMPLQEGKIPIVVPRQKKFKEHVNDHQLIFCTQVYERMKTIILVNDIQQLDDVIKNYEKYTEKLNGNVSGNNRVFNEKFEYLVNDLFKE